MRAEFEEKTFEQYLTAELMGSRQLFFSPGQVLESIVGFDAALWTSNPAFWKLFPHMVSWWNQMFLNYPRGTQLNQVWWQELEQAIDQFPKFKFNCFIQAKRPEWLVRTV